MIIINMSKYLVRYNVRCSTKEWEDSIIYNVEGDMTESDVINFENKISEKYDGSIVTMISFNKLADEKKSVPLSKKDKDELPNLAVFFLYDTYYDESVMVYTNVTDIVSYTFTNGHPKITLKDDNSEKIKTYECPIPGIWFGGKDVLDKIPDGLKKVFTHPYLFSIEYENYKRIK